MNKGVKAFFRILEQICGARESAKCLKLLAENRQQWEGTLVLGTKAGPFSK